MFGELERAVEAVDTDLDGADLVRLMALHDRLGAKVTAAVGSFDAAGTWEADAATSMTAWLRHLGRMTGRAAASLVRTARRLRRLPRTAAAYDDGTLSGGQVQAVVANVDDDTEAQFAAQEADLLPLLADLSVRQTAVVMQLWAARARALVDDDEPAEPERALYLSETLDGRRELKGSLDADSGDVVDTALRLAASPDAEGELPRRAATRRADALVDLCRFFLDRHDAPAGTRHRPHLNIVIDYDDLLARAAGRRMDGGVVAAATLQTYLCDAAVHRVITEGRSVILDYGSATRTVGANLWAALVLRDGHCRHPGCDRGPQWCEAHHVIPFSEGGPTSLENLVLRCSRHHHLVHRPGWSEKLRPEGTLVTTDRSGRTWTTHPARE